MGPTHDGVEFLEGSFLGFGEVRKFRMKEAGFWGIYINVRIHDIEIRSFSLAADICCIGRSSEIKANLIDQVQIEEIKFAGGLQTTRFDNQQV